MSSKHARKNSLISPITPVDRSAGRGCGRPSCEGPNARTRRAKRGLDCARGLTRRTYAGEKSGAPPTPQLGLCPGIAASSARGGGAYASTLSQPPGEIAGGAAARALLGQRINPRINLGQMHLDARPFPRVRTREELCGGYDGSGRRGDLRTR